ncbi:MAG: hypothetical protein G01um101433_528 [Parcubacteria group bacterium Gr01-1014_33]|nr:MAG: hypothetical protein G01um101433_528 [Parcubacteria group bacterium Gr01-1014_33]
MNLLRKLNPEWALRLGLGLMYVYSGADIIRHPTGWYWAVRQLPDALEKILTLFGMNAFLFMQGIGEVFLAFLLLAWFLPRKFLQIAAGIAVLEMGAILLLVGLDSITFRDIGLLGAAVALIIMAFQKNDASSENQKTLQSRTLGGST